MRIKIDTLTAPAALLPAPPPLDADGLLIAFRAREAILDPSLDFRATVRAVASAVVEVSVERIVKKALADFTAGGLVGEVTASIEKRGLGPGRKGPPDAPGRPVSDQLVPWSLL